MARWAVVQTHPNRERTALENIGRQGFKAYCPQVRKSVRHARQCRQVLRPMFPGYLFVRIEAAPCSPRALHSTIGVRSVVQFGREPGAVDDSFIAALVAREVDGAIHLPESTYRIGQQVRFAGGAFDDLVATIIGMDERDRLIVLMDMLNNRVRVKVEARGVTAA